MFPISIGASCFLILSGASAGFPPDDTPPALMSKLMFSLSPLFVMESELSEELISALLTVSAKVAMLLFFLLPALFLSRHNNRKRTCVKRALWVYDIRSGYDCRAANINFLPISLWV
jgi:hypothetical protein